MRVAMVLCAISGIAIAEPVIQPFEIATTVETALVAVDAKAPGTSTTVASIDKSDPFDPKMVRAAIAKLPVTIVEDHEERGTILLVVQAKSGARASIAVGKEGGSITTTLRPASTKPPGACVAIPQVSHRVDVHARSIDQRGAHRERAIHWDLATARLFDVDGDGIPDAFVPVVAGPETCPELVSYRVFVVRGRCGHDVGVVGPGSQAHDAHAVPLAGSGYRPITMSSSTTSYGRSGIPEMTTKTRRFEVTSGRYKEVDLQTTGGKCHHCATWSCRKP